MKLKIKKTTVVLLAILLISLSIRIFISLINVQTLLEKILIDDSFYEFSISKNIANGNFGSYNGIDKTNSIHPLWILIITVPYLITSNIYFSVNLILLIAAFIDVITVFVIYKLTEKIFNQKIAIFTALIYGLNPFIIFQTLNGMETVLNVFFVVSTFYFYIFFREKISFKNSLILGLIIGLSLLARADNVLLLISILLCILIENRKNIFRIIPTIFLIGIVSVLIFSPFPLWNFLNFGKISLSSYEARYNMNHGIFPFFDLKPPSNFSDNLKLIAENTFRGLGIILHHLGIISFNIFSPTAILPIFITIVLLFSLQSFKKLKFVLPYIFLIFGFYCFYFLGVQIRYFTAFIPFVFIFFVVGLQNLAKKISKNDKIFYLLFSLYLIILVINGLKQWDAGYFSWQREIYKIALWLRENTIPSDTIVCFSSGIPTYFSERRVINMDGVLNAEAAKAIANKSVISYMNSKNATIWVDSVYFNETVAKAYKNGFRFNILENNLWLDVLGEGKEDIVLLEQKEGIYKHLRGFEMLVVFFKANII